MQISTKVESLSETDLKVLEQRCEPLALGFIDLPAEADYSEYGSTSGTVSTEREISTGESDKRSAESSPCRTPADNSSIWITQLRNLASQLVASTTLFPPNDRSIPNSSNIGDNRTRTNETKDNTTAHPCCYQSDQQTGNASISTCATTDGEENTDEEDSISSCTDSVSVDPPSDGNKAGPMSSNSNAMVVCAASEFSDIDRPPSSQICTPQGTNFRTGIENSSVLSILDDPHSPEPLGYPDLFMPGNNEVDALQTETLGDLLYGEDPFRFLTEEISMLRGDISVPNEQDMGESPSQLLEQRSPAITATLSDALSISETGCQIEELMRDVIHTQNHAAAF